MGLVIKTGTHPATVPAGTREILMRYLRRARMPLDSAWEVFPGPKVKGTPHMAEFKTKKVTAHRGVQVRVKPGDNDTAYLYNIIPPNGMNPEQLLSALRDAEKMPVEKQVTTPKPPSELPAPSPQEMKRVESPSEDIPSPPTEERREEILRDLSSGKSLAGFTAEIQNIQLALIALSGKGDEDGWLTTAEARTVLREELLLSQASAKGLGSIIGTIERHGYFDGVRAKSGHLQRVRISLAGERLIAGEMEATKPPEEVGATDEEVAPLPEAPVVAGDSIVAAARQIEGELGQCEARREELLRELETLRVRQAKLRQALEALKPLLSK